MQFKSSGNSQASPLGSASLLVSLTKTTGIFRLFKGEIEYVCGRLKEFEDEEIPKRYRGEFVEPFLEALKRLEENGKRLILVFAGFMINKTCSS